ncbi:MAG: sigma 54-interacting transcriptional regulator, partial [Myxococcales bacterium]|nr:sigma 54-interacting transcriptional regulator [Myxococcales bacterium]
MEGRLIDWAELVELHVIKKLSQVINRRWNLQLIFVTDDHKLIAIGEAQAPRGLLAEIAAQEAQQLVGQFEEYRNYQGELSAIVQQSRLGLRRIVVPVIFDGVVLGCAFVSDFLSESAREHELEEAFKRAQYLNIDQNGVRKSLNALPVLTASDLSYLTELVELVVNEIVIFQSEMAKKERRLDLLKKNLMTRYSYDRIIGKSRRMQELYRLLDKVVESDSTVLIQGENGTGKELVAREVHYNSSRKDRPFVVQNCSAFNDNLLDSELFGHKKGAFTGAISDKQGLFEIADTGTFFLDEVGDMSPALQVKLLRVLQEGTFIPVGDTVTKRVDVRIIVATNRDLKRMVEQGQFREDLYYRINVINITLPPLRDRKDDVPLLVEYFLDRQARNKRARAKTLTKTTLEKLIDYHWPGNIRELENEIERLVVLAGEEHQITDDLLSPRIRQKSFHHDLFQNQDELTLPY